MFHLNQIEADVLVKKMAMSDEHTEKPKVDYDPGWNDPPIFSYDSVQAAAAHAGKRGPLLNKRVAYPLAGGVTSSSPTGGESSPCTPPTAPPMGPPPPGINPRPPATPSSTPAPTQPTADSHKALEIGVAVLRKVLDDLPGDDKREKYDIRKRLDTLQKMCEEDKLKPVIYGRLIELAEALQAGDSEKASHVQAGLMVDHVSLCTPWIAGVRLLVRRVAQPDA